MNKIDAKLIAETITNEQLQQMFDNAKNNITDWNISSIVNKYMTKGTAWNILYGANNTTGNHSHLAKTNMIREFGEFLPDELKPQKKICDKEPIIPYHQDPIF